MSGMRHPGREPQQLTRKPPKAVREVLCREVGFRCPVKDCGSPYLTFHHFGPPWRTQPHHNPNGMIALCSNHAAKADGGYYPDDYFQGLKERRVGSHTPVTGEFDYLRHDLAAIVGSNLYYEVDTLVMIDGERCVYFNRDEDDYLLLNFKMPSHSGVPRAWMEDNVWVVDPGARHIECPPRGRFLKVEFDNGDFFRIEFREVSDADEFCRRFPKQSHTAEVLTFPLTIAHLAERARDGLVEFGTDATRLPGNNVVRNSAMIRGGVGISIEGYGGISADVVRGLSSQVESYNRRLGKNRG